MTRLLVTGAAGLLGTEVVAAARRRGYEVVGVTREDLDVTDGTAVEARLRPAGAGSDASRFTAVVHCAAYTAVDRAEDEPDRVLEVNRDGTALVADAAARSGARFAYVSTDYVFDGRASAPYAPDATTAPLSMYGRSKLEGEGAALASQPGALVVRTSWLYGAGGRNFVTAMLERGRRGEALRVVADQRGRPTWARNAADGILDLLDRRVRGVWHVADGGDATWVDLARETFRLCGIAPVVTPVSSADWGAPAPRPLYSVLDVAGTEALLGFDRMDWREALARFLGEIGEIDAR